MDYLLWKGDGCYGKKHLHIRYDNDSTNSYCLKNLDFWAKKIITLFLGRTSDYFLTISVNRLYGFPLSIFILVYFMLKVNKFFPISTNSTPSSLTVFWQSSVRNIWKIRKVQIVYDIMSKNHNLESKLWLLNYSLI